MTAFIRKLIVEFEDHTNSIFLRSGKFTATTAIAASLIATRFHISGLRSFLSSIPLSSICAACNKSSVVICIKCNRISEIPKFPLWQSHTLIRSSILSKYYLSSSITHHVDSSDLNNVGKLCTNHSISHTGNSHIVHFLSHRLLTSMDLATVIKAYIYMQETILKARNLEEKIHSWIISMQ